jgi:hypothetical protein
MTQEEWNEVSRFLSDQFSSFVERGRIDAWLDSLTTDEGKALAVCLAIDLLSKAVESEDVAIVAHDLAELAHRGTDAFALAVDKDPQKSKFICISRLPKHNPALTRASYVRVIELLSFLMFCANPAYGFGLGQKGRAEFLRMFPPFAETGIDVDDVAACLSGNRGRVWVLPKEQFEEILQNNSDGAATFLNDALGLGYPVGGGPNGEPEFLAVIYPPEFKERCCQPTAFDAVWGGANFYLSHGDDDGWGRTHSCSGTKPPLKERVHPAIEKIPNGFYLLYVGTAQTPDPNRDAYLSAAIERYKSAKRGLGASSTS